MSAVPSDRDRPDVGSGGGEAAIWDTVGVARDWLDAANGTGRDELTMRLFKLVEEVGEVAAAWVGATGQNPRKGVTHQVEDVGAELGDVVMTALVAIASLGLDPRTVLMDTARKVRDRLTPAPGPERGGSV